MKKKAQLVKSKGNIFKDLGFDELEAKALHLRSSLMLRLNKYIADNQLTQKEAAKRFSVTQPRISNLVSGTVDLFRTNALLHMLEMSGFHVYNHIESILVAA